MQKKQNTYLMSVYLSNECVSCWCLGEIRARRTLYTSNSVTVQSIDNYFYTNIIALIIFCIHIV